MSESRLKLQRSDIEPETESLGVTIRILEAGVFRWELDNGRPDSPPDNAWQDCGAIELAVQRTHNVILSEGFAWAESRNHALVIAADGRPTVLEANVPENYALGLSLRSSGEFPVEGGDEIRLRLSLRAGSASAFDARILLENLPLADVAVAQADNFRCGANLEEFRGTFFTTGGVPAALVERSRLEISTQKGTRAFAAVVLDPRFSGACELRLSLSDHENETGRRSDYCAAGLQTGPGNLAIEIERTVGLDLIVAYFTLDVRLRPPGSNEVDYARTST